YGSYSYSHDDNNTLSTAYNQYWYPDQEILNTSNTVRNQINNNHRFEWEVEYKPNDNNYFKLSPSFSFSNNSQDGTETAQFNLNGNPQNSSSNYNTSASTAPNGGISGLFNHRFNDTGRNLFVNFSLRT